MKKLRIFAASVFLVLLTACGTTKTNTVETQEPNRGRVNTDVAPNENPTRSPRQTTREAGTNKEVVGATRNGSTSATAATNSDTATTDKMRKMYSDLNLTDEQIRNFESLWASSLNTWKRSNPNKTMNSFERTEYENRIMKGMLDDTQFKRYQQWARDNAE